MADDPDRDHGRAARGRTGRRAFLQAALVVTGTGLAARRVSLAYAEEPTQVEEAKPGSDERPQPGDVLVFAEGEHEGTIITPADVKAGGEPILAWPMDPKSKLVRDGSRLNEVVLVALDPKELDAETAPRAADGIVAYSAICTHAGCPVTGWVPAEEQGGMHVLKCFCHNSEYDPRRQATVIFGPAPRHLAALPIKIAEGAITVVKGFTGKVGAAQPA